MLKLATAIVLAAGVSTPAYAASHEESCKVQSEFATTVMTARQTNVPMSKLIEIVIKDDGSAADKTVVTKFMTLVIQAAYEEPLWQTDENKQNAVLSFANKIYLGCYKAKK